MSGRVHLSCPWCPWVEEYDTDEPKDKASEAGKARVEQHAADAGHRVIKGRKPRVGYWKGDPIS